MGSARGRAGDRGDVPELSHIGLFGVVVRSRLWTCVLLIPLVCGCDGPNEIAGRQRDRDEAMAVGQNITANGPNERIGEARDRVEEADRKARDAAADAMETRGDQLRKDADVEADRFDARARVMRNEAN